MPFSPIAPLILIQPLRLPMAILGFIYLSSSSYFYLTNAEPDSSMGMCDVQVLIVLLPHVVTTCSRARSVNMGYPDYRAVDAVGLPWFIVA
ncbi:hypothetical protein PENSPDRAFT_694046 [Peniophora sp. CONT]|nr:hypothetical protein PENSPDRAFT_694046 [Peniophora sp. CONT]